MASKTYELHHHFPKLAEESGFAFNTLRPRNRIDWNKIRLIDIENLIRERRFVLIEQHLSDILNCVLESEFDVRILDEGVLKMFRLAQLAVEYQQFCRHYLDRSVYVLREELTTLAQELEATRKDNREKDEEIRKFRKKTKHAYRTPLPYGNDNIATMILKTLTNKSDMFPSTSNGELQYNKCTYCDKVFLNQLYLKSHISRRHPNALEIPQRDFTETIHNSSNEQVNSKLNDDISELKSKLKEMQDTIAIVQSQTNTAIITETKRQTPDNEPTKNAKTKDVEVSTNNEDYFLDKFETWKKEEYEKYNKEINLLRAQIIETMNSFKAKEVPKPEQTESPLIDLLHVTIKEQGAEINALKEELIKSKLKSEEEDAARRKEADAQMSLWAKRAETQTKQHEALLQKLNDVAREAHESRATAEAETERAAHLQALLQQSITKQDENREYSNNRVTTDRNPNLIVNANTSVKKKPNPKSKTLSDRKTLENLHRKAQELLNLGSTSSSDVSNASVCKADNYNKNNIPKNIQDLNPEIVISNAVHNKLQHRTKSNFRDTSKMGNHLGETAKIKEQRPKRDKSKTQSKAALQEKPPVIVPGSPVKLVRAKITEEVHNRLVSVGVDPLKSRLPQSVFRKQRMQLQQQHEAKSKKNPAYQKVKHSILAYLDSNTSDMRKEVTTTDEYISPNKITKAFSLTSVISNVKNKALSLVKLNDTHMKTKRNALNAEVAKKAMSLLKTPPGSAPASPIAARHNPNEPKAKSISPAREMKINPSSNKLWYNSEVAAVNKEKQPRIVKQTTITANDSDEKSNDSDHKYYNSAIIQESSNSIESLIKSPARRPASASANYIGPNRKFTIDRGELKLTRTQSAANVLERNSSEANNKQSALGTSDSSSADVESLDIQVKKSKSEENIQNIPKQTKGVLKNASSTSSLNKKKVLFDMEAIQMKSVSASPSQSITDKNDANEKFELGLINLDGEDWDISSIENEPLKNDTRIQVNTRTSPKIAELKQTIESQLARRTETPSTVLVGGVDVLAGPLRRAASIAGSNTSLGSSILDDSENIPAVNNKAFVKPKKVTEKDDSELDISEYSIDGLINKKGNESF